MTDYDWGKLKQRVLNVSAVLILGSASGVPASLHYSSRGFVDSAMGALEQGISWGLAQSMEDLIMGERQKSTPDDQKIARWERLHQEYINDGIESLAKYREIYRENNGRSLECLIPFYWPVVLFND